jgi:hypothetical protein
MTATESEVPLKDLVDESRRVLDAARQRGVVVRLAGGLAIWHLCPAARNPPLSRQYGDLDLATTTGGVKPLTDLMLGLGYRPEARFNAMNGNTRLQFNDLANSRRVDVFVNELRMCHVIDFKDRIELLDDTLSAADLLLTKLQIVELNRKDLLDAIALLCDQKIGLGMSAGIDSGYLQRVWGQDWPLWRTSQLTLGKIGEAVPSILDENRSAVVLESVTALGTVIESGPKTLRWRLRARVGERIRWYELPEEV